MSSYMGDLGVYLNSNSTTRPTHSTSRENNTTLSFTDMLTLMVVQLQNQTMDDTADTSEMLNQMIQMQVVQSITDITDATVMTYASSLVGKEVTIGSYNSKGELVERLVTITGTGYSGGTQVLFAGDEIISLKDVMAVGKLPAKTENIEDEMANGSKPGTGTDPVEGGKPADKPEDKTDNVENPTEPAGSGETDNSGAKDEAEKVEPTQETEQGS